MQRDPCVLTENPTFSRPVRPNSGNKPDDRRSLFYFQPSFSSVLKRGLLSNVSKYVGSHYNCKDTITGESQVMSRSHEYRRRDENKQTNKISNGQTYLVR